MTDQVLPTSVALAISNGLLRDAIRTALLSVPSLKVVGEARSSEEAQGILEKASAKVVLMGVTLASQLPKPLCAYSNHDVKLVIIVPANTGPEAVIQCFVLGARGVVTNDVRMADLVRAVQLVSQGMLVLPALAPGSVHSALQLSSGRPSGDIRLAPREIELLQLLAQGYSEKEASITLQIGQRTIHTYLERIKGKLGAINRVHAASLAVAAGLVSPQRVEPSEGF